VPRRINRPTVALGLVVAVGLLGPASAALAASPTPPPADASNVVTFGIQPEGLGKIDQRGIFSYSATPGAHITDHAAILNYSTKPLTLRVNVADALNTSTGGFALTPDSQKPKDVGAWITFPASMTTVHVPPRSTTKAGVTTIGEFDLPISVKIPPTASPGDHVGGITVSLDSVAESPTGQKYKLVQRVGARVFVRVIGLLRPQLSVKNLSLHFHYSANPLGAGSATITYTVQNSGNIALGGSQAVQVQGWFGGTAHADKVAQIPLLLPGFSIQMQITVRGVHPEFRETAKVTIFPLEVPGSAVPPAGPWTATTSVWAIPLWLVLIVLLLAVLGLGDLFWRRRRMRPGPPDSNIASPDDGPPPGRPARDRTPEGALS
jgi:hypothetical protein